MYDIIGDIHGHADELIALLEQLGYEQRQGCYRHPERTAVFVGDFIDRGPQIAEALRLVRAMCEQHTALAVMGNHEFNALAYHTKDPSQPDRPLRSHSEKNVRQHAETLRQVPADELQDYLEWFRRLPMWLELDGVRVVHACWDTPQIAVLAEARKRFGGVTPEFLTEATRRGTPLCRAVVDVLKGKEVNLPAGASYFDKDGHERRAMRIQWFRSARGQTFAGYALTRDAGIPDAPLPEALAQVFQPYPQDGKPVFFGHYWLRADRPAPLAPNIACVDYSVAKGGLLCAYRWHGERELSADNFIRVLSRTNVSR